jgi:integrase-like protein
MLILLLYAAGLRIGEARSLRMTDVDLSAGILTIRESKFYKTRLVPMSPALNGTLGEYVAHRAKDHPTPSDAALFLTRTGTPVVRHTAENVFSRLRARAGVQRHDGGRYQPRLHDLRHYAEFRTMPSKSRPMVRPERRVLLAGESPVRVSARAPGSRPQPKAEMPPARAGRQKPVKEQGAKKRAATSSERCSLVRLSSERSWGGPSRSCHGEGNRQQPGQERLLDHPGVEGGGTFRKKSAEQERPNLAAQSGEDRWYKAGRLKSSGAGRESEGFVVPVKACKTTRWREGTLL